MRFADLSNSTDGAEVVNIHRPPCGMACWVLPRPRSRSSTHADPVHIRPSFVPKCRTRRIHRATRRDTLRKVACPFFHPDAPIEDGAWLKPPRVPLGDPCQGVCQASPVPSRPSFDDLRTFCNQGYARARCDRFPASSTADANRFSIAHDHNGAVELIYIRERDYAPIEHGPATYSLNDRAFTGLPDGDTAINAQARQFITSYLNRKTRQ